MSTEERLPLRGLDEEIALRSILEGTATETGERFFAALVENLAKALNTYGAARLLGMNPSTLTSRMKALGITRPR